MFEEKCISSLFIFLGKNSFSRFTFILFSCSFCFSIAALIIIISRLSLSVQRTSSNLKIYIPILAFHFWLCFQVFSSKLYVSTAFLRDCLNWSCLEDNSNYFYRIRARSIRTKMSFLFLMWSGMKHGIPSCMI